jgi:hypothetical protein
MNENSSDSRDRSRKCKADRNFENKIQYLLNVEEQLLQLISSRALLPGVLNGICIALDCQVGNVVSLISLPGDGAGELVAIATNAALFGLHIFCSEEMIAENGELLGSLEMYCIVRRSPSAAELQLIERAKCLAAIAIERQNEADQQGNCDVRGNRSVRARTPEWAVSVN